jgi:unsaturated rhamnogalacturonyl hydrolase
MWLDGIYMASLFSIEFARAFNEPPLFDEACHQITLAHRHTIDAKTGLLYHGWDESRTQAWADKQTGASPEFWGRAIGWYAMALVDALDSLPKDHAKRSELIKILQSLAASLARYQDQRTGLWYQIIDKGDRSDNWLETSSTSMFVYALAKGARLGYIDARYGERAKRAYQGILNNHLYRDEAGRFYLTGTAWIGTLNPRISKGDYDSYVGTARQLNDIKGVAAFLWASLEMERMAV